MCVQAAQRRKTIRRALFLTSICQNFVSFLEFSVWAHFILCRVVYVRIRGITCHGAGAVVVCFRRCHIYVCQCLPTHTWPAFVSQTLGQYLAVLLNVHVRACMSMYTYMSHNLHCTFALRYLVICNLTLIWYISKIYTCTIHVTAIATVALCSLHIKLASKVLYKL